MQIFIELYNSSVTNPAPSNLNYNITIVFFIFFSVICTTILSVFLRFICIGYSLETIFCFFSFLFLLYDRGFPDPIYIENLSSFSYFVILLSYYSLFGLLVFSSLLSLFPLLFTVFRYTFVVFHISFIFLIV